MRAAFAAVALLVVVLPPAGSTPLLAQTAPTSAVLQALILNPDTSTFYRRGTAFHVGNGIFYTNAHVVKSPSIPAGFKDWYLAGPNATLSPDSWIPVTIDCIHPAWRPMSDANRAVPYDIARLKVSGTPALPPALTISPRTPSQGMRVRIAGFPAASRGWPPVMYTAIGRVAEMYIENQNMLLEMEAGFVLQGSSGSPVFVDDTAVVGIIYGGEDTGQPRTGGGSQIAMTNQAMRSMCP
jgi:hypothetical protein